MTGWGSDWKAYEMETPDEYDNDVVEFLLESGFTEVMKRELPYIDNYEIIEYKNDKERDIEKRWRFFVRAKGKNVCNK